MAYTISQNLNIRPKYFPHVVVHVSAGDSNIPVHFSIYDGASPYTIPSGTTITVHGYRKDGGNWITSGSYSGNVVSFTLPSAAMAIEGAGIADVVFTKGNEVIGSSNFLLLVERATFPNGVTYSNDSSVFQDLLNFMNSSAIPEAISDWLEENITATSPAIDSTLSVQGAAADAKATGDALTSRTVTQATLTGNVVSFKNANDSEKFTLDLSALSPTTVSEFTQANVGKPADAYAVGLALENVLSTGLKNALMDCFAHVAWIDQNGQQYINTLHAELFSGSGRLPTGYREVEWIQPTGQQSNSIVIPLELQSATISFEIGFTLATAYYNEQDIFTIANGSATEPAILGFIYQNSKLGAYSRGGASADTNALVTIPTTGDIDYSCEYNETNETKAITYNGTTESALNKAKLSYLGSNLILFNGFRQTNNPFLQKFRYMRVESSGLSLDLVPCVRFDNVIGVFDLENEVFYAVSAGTFLVGPTVISEE